MINLFQGSGWGQRCQEGCLQVEILKMSPEEPSGVCQLNCRYSFYSNFGITICCWIFPQTRFMAHCHTPLTIIHEQISHSFYLLPCCLVFLVANLFKTILIVFLAIVVRTIFPILQVSKSRPRKEHGGDWFKLHYSGSKFRVFPIFLFCLFVGFKIDFHFILVSNFTNLYSLTWLGRF